MPWSSLKYTQRKKYEEAQPHGTTTEERIAKFCLDLDTIDGANFKVGELLKLLKIRNMFIPMKKVLKSMKNM